jgi:type VI secretion system secreted protein VgrG
MPVTSSDPILSVTTPAGGTLAVTAFEGREGVSRLFEFTVDLLADTDALAFDTLLGRGVTVHLLLGDNTPRHFHGLVRSVAQGGTTHDASGEQRTAYRLTLVPALWTLTRTRRSRIFQQMTVRQILEQVLTGLTMQVDLRGKYEPRNYCVQYRETDFEFVSRLMEEEGIFYFFKHVDGAHTLILGDEPAAHPALPGRPIPFKPTQGGAQPEDAIYGWQKEQTLTAGKVVLWDHTFEMPGRNHAATAPIHATTAVGAVTHKLAVGGNDAFELYDYPGGYAKRFDGVDPGGGERAADLQKIARDNDRTVKLRMQAEEAGAVATEGASTCRQLMAGHKFTVAGHPNADGTYVVMELEHEASAGDVAMSGSSEGFEYKNRFVCIPASVPARPPRSTPRPLVTGCQTATVVGPRGEEIYVDKYGRVKVQFHWDREGQRDANSSCWVRVATPWAGKMWGAVHLPRIGQEVVVDFLEGDPDRPIILGSVYNAEQMPPYALPENRTQSGVKSRSSPQGTDEMFNELRFEDKKGEEHIFLQAQKDLKVLVENDETRDVLHDRTTTITNHDTRFVKEGDDQHTIEKGDHVFEVSKGDHMLSVVEGKQNILVKKDQITIIDTGDCLVEVNTGHAQTQVHTGNLSILVTRGTSGSRPTSGRSRSRRCRGSS